MWHFDLKGPPFLWVPRAPQRTHTPSCDTWPASGSEYSDAVPLGNQRQPRTPSGSNLCRVGGYLQAYYINFKDVGIKLIYCRSFYINVMFSSQYLILMTLLSSQLANYRPQQQHCQQLVLSFNQSRAQAQGLAWVLIVLESELCPRLRFNHENVPYNIIHQQKFENIMIIREILK